jgi:hypothetical protein
MNFIGLILFFLISHFSASPINKNSANINLLSSQSISLEKRYEKDKHINNVFKDNILLNIAYMFGKVRKKEDISWDELKKPFKYEFVLMPKKTFAFHDDVFKTYENSLAKTTNAHFDFNDGFKSDGYLTGDGVCHLASLIYWVAKNARLETYAPTNHNFIAIPQIDKKYGVSIYRMPGHISENAMQNLYITNNKNKPIVFSFSYNGNHLGVAVSVVDQVSL